MYVFVVFIFAPNASDGLAVAYTEPLVPAYVGDDDDSFRIRMIAGCIVAVIVVLSAIIILTVVYLRSKSNDECNKKQPSDCDTLEYRNGEGESRFSEIVT